MSEAIGALALCWGGRQGLANALVQALMAPGATRRHLSMVSRSWEHVQPPVEEVPLISLLFAVCSLEGREVPGTPSSAQGLTCSRSSVRLPHRVACPLTKVTGMGRPHVHRNCSCDLSLRHGLSVSLLILLAHQLRLPAACPPLLTLLA